MSSDTPEGRAAKEAAEEVLRILRAAGQDLEHEDIDEIAGIVERAWQQSKNQNQEILDLLVKVVQAIHLLATPPSQEEITDATQLRTLLGERLDAIHQITGKTLSVTGYPEISPNN